MGRGVSLKVALSIKDKSRNKTEKENKERLDGVAGHADDGRAGAKGKRPAKREGCGQWNGGFGKAWLASGYARRDVERIGRETVWSVTCG